ncbi:MAG: carbohydrate ABC transporter permease [Anaerolineae bacterium]|nr:carbohydrate ABC transporter permease [Anaerolineae bacterium]
MHTPLSSPSPAARRRSALLRRAVNRILTYGALMALTTIIVAPFLWLLTSTLRPVSELYVQPPRWIPSQITLAGYAKALKVFALPLVNSITYGIATALLSLLVACPAAYSLARYLYPGKRAVITALLITQMLPFVLLLLPLYIAYLRLHLYNTRIGLIIGYTALTIPYSILLLRSYFSTLPAELEDAAMIDGCTRMGALWRVVLPLSKPVLMAVILNNIVLVWNDVLFTIFLSKDMPKQTASVALYLFYTLRQQSGGIAQKEIMLAGGVLLTLPVIILFIFLQKYLVKGMTLGALKG